MSKLIRSGAAAAWLAAMAVGAAADEPFQANVLFTVPPGLNARCASLTTVPLNKRFVIEHLSASIDPDGGPDPYLFELRTHTGSTWAWHEILLAEQGPRWIVSQALRLYSEANDNLPACVYRLGTTNQMGVAITVSGVLVDVP